MPEQLHFMRPEWLWLLAPAALLALGLWLQRRRAGSWNDVIDPELLKHLVGEAGGRSQRSLLPLLLLAWIIAAIAATGPSWKQIPQPVHQKQDAWFSCWTSVIR